MGHVTLPLTNNSNCGFDYLEVEKMEDKNLISIFAIK